MRLGFRPIRPVRLPRSLPRGALQVAAMVACVTAILWSVALGPVGLLAAGVACCILIRVFLRLLFGRR